jgi:PASTA domain
MRRAAVAAIVGVLALAGATSASAQEEPASLQLAGVPATLTIPGSFTLTVSGSTGTASNALIYLVYGPAPCVATVETQLGASPEEILVSPDAEEVPAFGFTGSFTVHAEGFGQAVSSPGVYSVCVFMEAPEESEAAEASAEEESVIAVASATFRVLPALTGTAPAPVPRMRVNRCVVPRVKGRGPRSGRKAIARAHCAVVRRCIVPHIRGRRLRSALKAIRRAHCALGRVESADSRHVKKGRVTWQSRRAGTSLPRGTRVNLLISSGMRRRAPSARICARAPQARRHRLRCPKDGRQ